MERWSVITVVVTGAIMAGWARALAGTPTSAKLQVLLGVGAVITSALVILRVYRNSLMRRKAYETTLARTPNFAALPDDPTEGFLGDGWKAPAALIAAFGLAYKLLELSGAAALFSGS